jgi:hypothetical protein
MDFASPLSIDFASPHLFVNSQEAITVENLLEIYEFAQMYAANNLKLSCVDFFLRTETIKAITLQSAEPVHVAYSELISLVLTGKWKDLKVEVYSSPQAAARPPVR